MKNEKDLKPKFEKDGEGMPETQKFTKCCVIFTAEEQQQFENIFEQLKKHTQAARESVTSAVGLVSNMGLNAFLQNPTLSFEAAKLFSAAAFIGSENSMFDNWCKFIKSGINQKKMSLEKLIESLSDAELEEVETAIRTRKMHEIKLEKSATDETEG